MAETSPKLNIFLIYRIARLKCIPQKLYHRDISADYLSKQYYAIYLLSPLCFNSARFFFIPSVLLEKRSAE
jgi:hypothetical protein